MQTVFFNKSLVTYYNSTNIFWKSHNKITNAIFYKDGLKLEAQVLFRLSDQ